MQALRHFLLALQFFTRIPVTGRLAAWVGFSPAMLRASAAHFPGVGWIAGAVGAAAYAGVHWALDSSPFAPLAAAVLCCVATAWLTGGFHEDGLADVADGLGGSVDRERALDIMKDSRLGAYGALALVLALLAKISLLAVLGSHSLLAAAAAVALAHVVSRFFPLCLVRTLEHVGDTARSKSKPLADRISARALGAALLWCVPALALYAQLQPLMAWALGLLGSALAALWMGRWFAQRLQGFTGDCLGATQQVCEIAFYLGAAAAVLHGAA
jgi:adenosylcobinamide-GDP ribazoletransferase